MGEIDDRLASVSFQKSVYPCQVQVDIFNLTLSLFPSVDTRMGEF